MRSRSYVSALAVFLALASPGASPAEREMNVRQGPEAVFDRPAAQVMGELARARPTGENGRIGNEAVFWGYALDDGRDVFLFACAMLADVDCEQRLDSVCITNGTILRNTSVPGKVRRLQCRALSVGPPGDMRPGCLDTETTYDLTVALVQCL